MLRFVWLLDGQRDNRCCSFLLRFVHQMPYYDISFSHWEGLSGAVVHGRMVNVDYFMWESFVMLGHILHFDEMDNFMPCIYDSLFYTGINISMISYCFHSQFTSWFEYILYLSLDLWYCGWIHMTLLKTEMDRIRCHAESVNGFLKRVFMR